MKPSIAQPNAFGQSSRATWGGKLILLAFVLTILEGAARKWIVPGANPLRYLAYFSKDIALVLAGVVGMQKCGSVFRSRAGWVLGISALLILPFALLNIDNSTPVGALLSLRAYVILPVCAYLAAGTINSWKDIDRIVATVCVVATFVAALGLVQFWLPASHWLNHYDIEDAAITVNYDHVRATGTFAYISGMAAMAGFAAWAAMYFFLTGGGLVRRGLAVAAAVSGLICGLVSMSRSGFIPWLLIIAVSPLCFGRRKEVMYVALLALVGIWFVGGMESDDSAEPEFAAVAVRRFEHADSVGARVLYFIDDFTNGISQAPLGTGLGSGQVGGYAAEGVAVNRYYCENEFGRIVMEIGILGFAAVLMIRVRAIWMVGAELFAKPHRRLMALCAASLPYLAVAAVLGFAFNHTLSSFFWGIVALTAGAIRLEYAKQGSVAI